MIRTLTTGALVLALRLAIAACVLPGQASAQAVASAGSREDDLVNQHLAAGDRFRASGLLQEAIGEYESAMKIDPENPAVYERLGYALVEVQDYERAAKTYRRWVDLRPKDCRSHAGLGYAYLKQRLTDQAMRSYEQATQLCVDDPDVFAGMGAAYREAGYRVEAAEAFRRAIELDPDDIAAYESLAAVYWDLELYPEAIAGYEAILARPDHGKDAAWVASARGRLAHMYAAAGSYENAIPHHRYVMESADADEAARLRAVHGLSVAYERTGQLGPAIELYESLIEKTPDRSDYHYRLGELLNDDGRYSDAIARVEQGRQRDSGCGARGYCVAGVAYEKLGQYERATEEFRKALGCNDESFNEYAAKQIERQEQLRKIEEMKKQKEKYGTAPAPPAEEPTSPDESDR
jgi:tetratricopeptide (TPR) repeat protein